MSKHKWKVNQPAGFWLALVILLQTVVYVLAGAGKAYIHMDEAYSLALAQYDKIDITENSDFYNIWHTAEYYQDYLAVQEKDRGNWQPVYENQKNDVHPPLYYLLLRGAMELMPGKFSKWPGIILNIIIMAGCTVLLYLVTCKLLASEKQAKGKAVAVAAVAGLTVAGVSTVVYIRMYALLTLMVLLTLWLHLKLQERAKWSWDVLIGVVAVLGTLTQYYYLFFLFGLVMVTSIGYLRNKRWAELAKYLGSLVVAGGVVLLIWPHILQHMFFGYRGQGVLNNLVNLPALFQHLLSYCLIIDYNVFHRMLGALILVIVGCIFYKLSSNSVSLSKSNPSLCSGRDFDPAQPPNNSQIAYKIFQSYSSTFNVILWSTVSYFVLAAVASPFIELRYIMPVCGLIFVLVMYGVYVSLKNVLTERWRDISILVGMAVILVVAPVQISLGWMRVELLYRDRLAVMTTVTENPEAPILYFITTENNRFLDNILPFTEAKESYLALDMLEPTTNGVEQILAGKDLSHGLILFVSSSQDQQKALEAVTESTGLSQVNWVQGINTCDVYYLRK